MTWWDVVSRKWKDTPPIIKGVIDNKEYETTEWCRRRAAINMRLDSVKKRAVEELLQTELGKEKGLKESRRRYPEAYE